MSLQIPQLSIMGIDSISQDVGQGLEIYGVSFKRKNHWKFTLLPAPYEPATTGNNGIIAIPHSKIGRPSLGFKEYEAQHTSETIYFPVKPEWRPIIVTFYEAITQINDNQVYQWINKTYDPEVGTFYTNEIEAGFNGPTPLKRNANLILYNGCGCPIEGWRIEEAFPQFIDFGELDMSSSDVVTIDVTLRYSRMYKLNIVALNTESPIAQETPPFA